MRGADVFTRDRARSLRQASTDAERTLWRLLRDRSLHGHKFVRQQAIGPYFIDFVCRKHRLIIELDGGQHAESKRDAVRDAWLAQQGYRILRFWNNDVLATVDGVWETIAASLPADSAPPPER